MHVIVSTLELDVPAAQIAEAFERDCVPLLQSCEGFGGALMLDVGDGACTFVINWDTEEQTQRWINEVGPTWFGPTVVPHLRSQDRRVGNALIRVKPAPAVG